MDESIRGIFSNLDVDTIEEIANIETRGASRLWVTFTVGAANLSAFDVYFKTHPEGGWALIASAAVDFTTPEGPVLGASGDLTTAASGATVHFLNLDVQGVYAVRLRAAGTSSTVAGYFGAN